MYKIRRAYRRGPRNEFYINVADFHLKKPTRKIKDFDFPIIHVRSYEDDRD
jgi:hypothetical protein